MKIAPGIDADDWKRLDLGNPDSSDWERAISIFEYRIRGRFTDAVDFLIADDEQRPVAERRFGFAILAVDCFLVETLEAFRQGLTDTRSRSIFAIDPIEPIGGSLPQRQRRLVEAWAEIHQAELLGAWERLQSGRPPGKIEPLR